MNGKQHLLSGVTIAAFNVASYEQIVTKWTNTSAVDSVMQIKDFFTPDYVILYPVCAAFFLLGLLLPDCDDSKSMIGRFAYLPVEHRTWTHTLWVVLMLFGLGFLFNPFFCLAYGYFLHLFVDSFSRCGVCWLYPITKYKHFGPNAKIKDKHFIFLYAGADPSAWILCGILLTLVCLYIIGVLGWITPITECVDSIDSKIEALVSFFIRNKA